MIIKGRKFITENYDKDISLDDVSRHLNLSPYYFSKLFKSETGTTFVEYLTNLRMERAQELLKDESLSIKEICAAVGYADPNYFSRTFKKNVGVTPTVYREGSKNEE
jgi:two-component system response regulator YesN